MTLTTPPKTTAPLDEGYLNAAITASATSITVAPIFKYVNGVKTKQGFNTTSGFAIIEFAGKKERISFESNSVDSTTKVSTLGTCVRGLSLTSTTASYAEGTGMAFPKGAKITVVQDAAYIQSGVFTTGTHTITGQLRGSGTDAATFRMNSVTTAQREAMTAANGDMVYDSDLAQVYQYIGGAWAAVGDTGTATATEAAEGKVELATVAEHDPTTTGARVVQAKNTVKTSSGAGDENKIPLLGASGTLAVGFLGTGTPSASNVLLGDGSFGSADAALSGVMSPLFATGADGAKVIAASEDLNPATEFEYTTLTLAAGQTLGVTSVNTPLIIKCTSDVTINGTVDLNGKGGAGGASVTTTSTSGNAGTVGKTIIDGISITGGGGGVFGASPAGGGGGGGSYIRDGTSGGAGGAGSTGGAGGTSNTRDGMAFVSSFLRGMACGSGGGSGGVGSAPSTSGVGGAGGGCMGLFVGGDLTLGASSIIRANGANGGNAVDGTPGGANGGSGGGGGGGGTVIILVAGSITNNGVTATATGGTEGADDGGGEPHGGAGSAGIVLIYSLKDGTLITA